MSHLRIATRLSALPHELFQIIYKIVMEETLSIIQTIESYDFIYEDETVQRVFWWQYSNRGWGSLHISETLKF